ncbi:MAG: formylglycine-generating enzyme family protein [Anaerolineae bacterium]|jgi:formylglycine-generating enzyme required for sulfatase activity|nr:formylglycine-generating enzyme family protein [Anaerolineae bacterium]
MTAHRLKFGISILILALIVGIYGFIQWEDARLTMAHQRQILPSALQRADAFGQLENPTHRDWQPFIHHFEDGVPMVLVPPGCFRMGDADLIDAGPVHEQCFDQAFWIDQTEVTQGQFARLGGQSAQPPRFAGERLPVENITWFEAHDFCARRGARLPTEREWEYAARGVENWVYPWGDYPPNRNLAVYTYQPPDMTRWVLSVPAGNAWVGAADLIGNVAEWTSTIYQGYPYSPDDGREDPTDPTTPRIFRGIGWNFGENGDFSAALRFFYPPIFTDSSLGFRCARSSY